MAARYWVGGTAAWDAVAGSKWALTSGGTGGQAVPTATDDVFFDAASGAVTVTASLGVCLSLTCTGFTGTLTGTVTVSGSTTLSTGAGTYTGLALTQNATGTITGNNRTVSSYTINGSAITATLGSALTVSNTGTTTLTLGALNLNGFDLTTGAFSSSSSSIRSIAFGANNITLNHATSATTVLSMATATNFTWTGTGGFVSNAAVTRTFTFGTTGGSTTNAPNLTLTGSGTSVLTFTTASWFNNLNFGTTAFTVAVTTLNIAGNLVLSSGGTYTNMTVTYVGNGTLTSNSKTIAALTIDNGAVSGTMTLGGALTTVSNIGTTTLTSGTLTLNGFNLNTGIFSSNNSNTRAINFGNAKIVCLYTLGTVTILSMATITGLTCTGTGGFSLDNARPHTITCGSTAGSAANAPNLFFTNSGLTAIMVFTDGSWFKTMDLSALPSANFDMSGVTQGVMIDTLVPSATALNLGTFLPVFTRTQTVNTASFNATTTIRGIGVNGAGVTLTLGSSLPMNFGFAVIIVTQGTLDLNGYSLQGGSFVSSNSNTRGVAFTNGGIIDLFISSGSLAMAANATNFVASGSGGFIIDVSGVAGKSYSFGATTGGAALGTNAPNVEFYDGGGSNPAFTLNGYWKNCTLGSLTYGQLSGSTVGGTPFISGNLTLNSTFTTAFASLFFTITGNSTLYFNGRRTQLTINAPGSTVKLGTGWNTTGVFSPVTLTAGTLDLNGLDLYCNAFNSNNSNSRSIVFGSRNININTSSAGVTVLNMATLTNLRYTGTGGFVSLNTNESPRIYTCGTTGILDAASVPTLTIQRFTSTQTITSGSGFKNLTISGTGSVALATTTVNMWGNLTLDPNSGDLGVYTGLAVTYPGSGTVTTNNRTISSFAINGTGATATLGGALACSGAVTLTQGTFDAVTFNITARTFGSIGSATRRLIMGTGTWTLTGDVSVGSSHTWAVSNISTSNMTIVPGTATINITSSTAFPEFRGGDFTYYNLIYSGSSIVDPQALLTIVDSNTFNSIANNNQPCRIWFDSGETTTVQNFTVSGADADNLVELTSTVVGSQATLYRPGGVYSWPFLNYLAISELAATDGPWYAGADSLDFGNNSGWIFSNPPPPTVGPGIEIGPGIAIGG